MEASTLLDACYWQELVPWLTCTAAASAAPALRAACAPAPASWRSRLVDAGFVRLTAPEVWGADAACAVRETLVRGLADGVAALVAAGVHPSFIAVYDEAWELQAAVAGLVRGALGDAYVALGDWAAFHVRAGTRGWPPHRDRPSLGTCGDARAATATGAPSYVTAWVALTNASPETSCLYFLPRCADPGFEPCAAAGAPAAAAAGTPAAAAGAPPACPLATACTQPATFQAITAMPVARGGLLAFGGRTCHWGSAPLAPAPGEPPRAPRTALSFAFAHPDACEAPALTSAVRGVGGAARPPLEVRAALVAAQAIVYHSQAPLSPREASCFLAVFDAVHGEGGGGGGGGGSDGSGSPFTPAYAARVRAGGQWIRFSTRAAAQQRGGGMPSGADVALMFAGLAAAREGLDAAAYL